MDENTIFQGVSPAPSASAPPQPAQNTAPIPPVQQPSYQPQPIQNVTPQPVVAPGYAVTQPVSAAPAPSVFPAPGSPIPPQPIAPVPGSPIPPPPGILPSSGKGPKSGSSLPFGGILKILGGIIGVIILGFLIFGVIVPMFSPKDEKVTLTYWGLWEDPNIMQKAIDDFQKQHPNIKITYEKQSVKDQYRNKLLTRIANGNGPDIFEFHNSWVPQMQKILTPVPKDIISPTDFRKAYFPVVSNDVIRNGAIYGVPLQMDTLALFTNTEMLQASSIEPPTNWEDFGKDARILTVKDEEGNIKTAGAALGTYDNVTHAPDIMSLLFLQNGANIYDLSSTPKESTDALSYYVDDYAKGESNVWDGTLDPSLLAFAKGNLAMYFGYSWEIFALQGMNPQLQFQVSSVPHISGGRDISVASYWVEGVSQKSKHQKQAMLFMKYLSQKETLEKLFTEASKTRQFGQLYPRPDLADSLKDNKLIYPFVSQANNAVSTFFVSDTYDEGVNDHANTYLQKAIGGMLDNTSVETALENLSQGVSQVLENYGYAR